MTSKPKLPAPPKPEEMTTCKSSMLCGWHYDAQAHRLTVQFASGGLYSYDDVAPELANQFKAAKSIGSFFAANIRGRPFVKHQQDQPESNDGEAI